MPISTKLFGVPEKNARPRPGDTVIRVESRGCMAEDKRLQWVGRLIDWSQETYPGSTRTYINYEVELDYLPNVATGAPAVGRRDVPDAWMRRIAPGIWIAED